MEVGNNVKFKTGKTCHTHSKEKTGEVTSIDGDNYKVTISGATTTTNACKSCITIVAK